MYIKLHSILFVFFVIKLSFIVVDLLSRLMQPLPGAGQLGGSTKNSSGIRKKGEGFGNESYFLLFVFFCLFVCLQVFVFSSVHSAFLVLLSIDRTPGSSQFDALPVLRRKKGTEGTTSLLRRGLNVRNRNPLCQASALHVGLRLHSHHSVDFPHLKKSL